MLTDFKSITFYDFNTLAQILGLKLEIKGAKSLQWQLY